MILVDLKLMSLVPVIVEEVKLLSTSWSSLASVNIKVNSELNTTTKWKGWSAKQEHNQIYLQLYTWCYKEHTHGCLHRGILPTCSHQMSLNLKSGNLKYLHISNLQVLLAFFTLKSCFYSQKCGCDAFLKVACVAEVILRKSAFKFSLCTG